MRNALFSLIMAGLLATTAIAGDDHSSHAAMHDGVQTEATIHHIDGNTVNLSHGPIPEIGWPAMTMDLQLLEGAEVGEITEGLDAMILLEKGEDGMYAIRAVTPVE